MRKDANLVELEKCCRTHIFLQNFVLIQPRTSPPKICKFWGKIPKNANLTDFANANTAATAKGSRGGLQAAGRGRGAEAAPAPPRGTRVSGPVGWLPIFGKFSAKCRSFSAVSAPIFADKYAIFNIF